eukprot:COSAG06_NODE_39560_length_411_cov_0.807692_1_plen_62_part_01
MLRVSKQARRSRQTDSKLTLRHRQLWTHQHMMPTVVSSSYRLSSYGLWEFLQTDEHHACHGS